MPQNLVIVQGGETLLTLILAEGVGRTLIQFSFRLRNERREVVSRSLGRITKKNNHSAHIRGR